MNSYACDTYTNSKNIEFSGSERHFHKQTKGHVQLEGVYLKIVRRHIVPECIAEQERFFKTGYRSIVHTHSTIFLYGWFL